MSEIKVSVSMLVYNHEKYLREAIEGVLMQEVNFPIELLIHDDASTDGSVAIIKEYEKRYPSIIKPIYQTENQHSQGIRISWTYNYPRAKGRYIALCEGDDYWTDKRKLQMQVDYLEQHKECSMCFHAGDEVNEESEITSTIKPYEDETDCDMTDIVLGKVSCITAAIVFRADFHFVLPTFMKDSKVGDYPLKILLASKGTLHYFPLKMAAYRCGHPGSWTVLTFNSADSHKKEEELLTTTIEMLERFNVYSNHEYNDILCQEIEWLKLEDLNRKEIRIKLRNKIINGEFKLKLSKVNRSEKVNLYFRLYFPMFYKWAKKMKRMIQL